MRRYVINPDTQSIEAEEAERPDIGAGEVMVRVRAAALNYRDLIVAKTSRRPVVPLSDGAGEIIEVGEGVTDLSVGDRVVGLFFPNWMDGPVSAEAIGTLRGGDIDGMLTEIVVGDASGFVRFPDYLSYEQASTLPCAALTAWHALFEHPNPAEADQTVLLQGTGGVSVFALQLAASRGIDTIVTSSSDEKLERARARGATHTINYKANLDWDGAARELTDGRGVDLVVEVGGGGTFDKSMSALREAGTISLIGALAGMGGEVNPLPIQRKALQVYGIKVGSRAMQTRLHEALTELSIQPVVDRVFPFEDAAASFSYQESGSHFGKVVVAC